MAAPPEKTNKDINGKWALNKTLSDSAEPALAIQGIGFLTRKAIGLAAIQIEVSQYEAPPKPPSTSTDVVTHIDITQTASKLSSTQEERCLDGLFREHSDWLFGSVKGQTNWVSVDDVQDEFLKTGWLSEGEGKNFVNSHVESLDNGWTADQVWGFRTVEGERRYCRRIVVAKGDKKAEITFVYDYIG